MTNITINNKKHTIELTKKDYNKASKFGTPEYDDKIVITFNYKEGTKTVTFDDVKASLSEGKSSDLDSSAVPTKTVQVEKLGRFLFCLKSTKNQHFRLYFNFIHSLQRPKLAQNPGNPYYYEPKVQYCFTPELPAFRLQKEAKGTFPFASIHLF